MQGLVRGYYPLSEEIHATTLSLPIAFFHTEEDVQRVAETLNGWLK
jgi:dTDP-4-amino-4,6-dideoxygalactose transaminase